jgi:hypothetical protein
MRGRIEGLQLLIDQARRDRVAEQLWFGQLWFGQLCRASTAPVTRDLPISYLGERARLTPDHLRRAVEWSTRSERPRVTLPGGHVLPTRGRITRADTLNASATLGLPATPSYEYLCGLRLISAIKSSTICS